MLHAWQLATSIFLANVNVLNKFRREYFTEHLL